MTNHEAILSLIKVLGKPNNMLVFNINLHDRSFDGIRLCDNDWDDYELFEDITHKLKSIEDIEEIYPSSFLNSQDEEYIKNILESFL